MKTIERLFKEVRMEVYKVAFLNSFLNTCIVFFASYLAIIFLDLKWIYALVLSAIFFIGNFIHWKNKLDLKTFEEANPTVKEMLRTARDNQDDKNVLTLGLFYDVVKNMKKASSGNLVDSNVLFKKVLAITILTFAVVFVSSLEIYLGNIALPTSAINDGVASVFRGNDSAGDRKNTSLNAIGFNQSQNLYGNDSLAKLGKEELNLKINPGMNQINFNKEKSLEEKSFSKKSYPSEAEAQASDFSGNDVPEEAELAKEYNLELKGD